MVDRTVLGVLGTLDWWVVAMEVVMWKYVVGVGIVYGSCVLYCGGIWYIIIRMVVCCWVVRVVLSWKLLGFNIEYSYGVGNYAIQYHGVYDAVYTMGCGIVYMLMRIVWYVMIVYMVVGVGGVHGCAWV